MRRLMLIALVLLIASPPSVAMAQAETPGPALQLISLVGQAQVNGKPIKAGQGALAEKADLTLAQGAVAQLIIGSVSVSVAGPGTLRLLEPHLAVMTYSGTGVLRVAGGPAHVSAGRISLSLRAGSCAILRGEALFIVAGEVLVSSSSNKAPPTRLKVGQVQVPAGQWSPGLFNAEAGAKLQRQLDAFQAPATWTPNVTEFSLDDIQRAEGSAQRERQAQKETAACGCTEGGGTGEGVGDGKGGAGSTPETFTTPVRVKVRGVPKGVSK
jgi:hypothetical protein